MVGSTTGIKIQQQKFASQCRDTTRSMSIWREVFCGNYQILNFSVLFSESRTSDCGSRFTLRSLSTSLPGPLDTCSRFIGVERRPASYGKHCGQVGRLLLLSCNALPYSWVETHSLPTLARCYRAQ